MGSLSIQKGKRAERDVARRLNESLALVCGQAGVPVARLQRNLKQVQQGGFDLDGLDWLAIEIKHHKQVSLGSWWAQTLRQATDEREPILIWKQHGGQWRVRMFSRLVIEQGRLLRVVADIDWESFIVWFEKRAEVEIKKIAGDTFLVAEGLFGP